VRFLDRPKAPGHGFLYSHEAVEDAASARILYLSDDDLWFPEHAAVMCELLEEADFAAGLGITVGSAGPRLKHPTDLSLSHYRDLVRSRTALLQLSATGHTQESYRRLPQGWLVEEDPDYKAFWAQYFEAPWRTASAPRPTVVQFPSTQRPGMSLDERAAELESWEGALARSTDRLVLTERLLAMELRRSAELTSRVAILKAKRAEQKRRATERRLAKDSAKAPARGGTQATRGSWRAWLRRASRRPAR
jgi:hypothetical protein